MTVANGDEKKRIAKEIFAFINSDSVDFNALKTYQTSDGIYVCKMVRRSIIQRCLEQGRSVDETEYKILRNAGKALIHYFGLDGVIESRKNVRNALRSQAVDPKSLVDAYDKYQMVISEYERVELKSEEASAKREVVRPRLYADCDKLDKRVLDILKTKSKEMQKDSIPLSESYRSNTPQEFLPSKPQVPFELQNTPVQLPDQIAPLPPVVKSISNTSYEKFRIEMEQIGKELDDLIK